MTGRLRGRWLSLAVKFEYGSVLAVLMEKRVAGDEVQPGDMIGWGGLAEDHSALTMPGGGDDSDGWRYTPHWPAHQWCKMNGVLQRVDVLVFLGLNAHLHDSIATSFRQECLVRCLDWILAQDRCLLLFCTSQTSRLWRGVLG
jgi:hypothetical protein